MSTPQTSAPLSTCDNCDTVLVGGFCHVCGQRAHNPLHDLRHAAEEVFESFWHVDGRILVTLRDMLVPGRLAAAFLAGKRAKYIPPLRLFLIMSVLTFFVGRLVIHMGPLPNGPVDENGQLRSNDMKVGLEEIQRARTVEDVLKARASALKEIAELRDQPVGQALLTMFGTNTETSMQNAARERLIALHATPEQLRDAGYEIDKSWTPPDTAGDVSGAVDAQVHPGFLARWFEHRMERLQQNAMAIHKDPDTLIRLVLGAVPGALLLLMPVFALCLKLLYIRSRRSYLEHLVVAMYSHVAMLDALLLGFIALGLRSTIGGNGATALTALFCGMLFGVVMPLYLLFMQKRVYAQGWLKTLVKYVLLGNVYTMLLLFALLYALFAGMTS